MKTSTACLFIAVATLVFSPRTLLDAAEPTLVEVIVLPRKAAWSQIDTWFFDVTVRNASDAEIEIPYICDAIIEIDGSRYTQFPKPVVEPKSDRTIAPRTKESHGTLTLNGTAFMTVDAKTGKVPLKLATGEHTLKLSVGDYESKAVSFKISD